jgi:hypothetical protein
VGAPALSLLGLLTERLGEVRAVAGPLRRLSVRSLELFELCGQGVHLFPSGHHRDDLLAAHFGLIEGAVALAAVEDGEAVADRVGVVDVVAYEDYG